MAERADIQWVVAALEDYLEPLALTLTEHSKGSDTPMNHSQSILNLRPRLLSLIFPRAYCLSLLSPPTCFKIIHA
ncbi:hypothetical protein Pcinc_001536 [Petrolisthes cinctipes]|uniref:Uncharacterized protein n=1 Tax=Petrolisthes cinctipes TaxID=88211 RepID=A0AAE1GMP5_PETCI|nr:hypothetical protein Pcinc_001536 [Petrolisthes cinctipes]